VDYKIITDSCCDHPEDNAWTWLTWVPLFVNLGEKTFTDDDTLDPADLLGEISKSAVGPKSACPSPGTFAEHYAGPERDIYVICISKELSGTYNSALQGAEIFKEEHPEKNIHVFNSKTASAGQVQICKRVHELAASGLPFAEVVQQAEAFIAETETMLVLEDLDILRKSGRMGALQAALTGTLKIKLVMGGTKEGTIQKVTQALSINQALNKMTDLVSAHAQKVNKGKIKSLIITHCFAKERAEYVKDKLKGTCDVAETVICKAGGISTMYANRGGIIVSFV